MPITEDDARNLIPKIEAAVREAASGADKQGVINLLKQWRAEVEAGRSIDRKLSVQKSPGLDELAGVPRSSTTSSGEFVGKEDYTSIEQLDMLVETLGLAFIAPQMMASRFFEAVMDFSPQKSKDDTELCVKLAEDEGEVSFKYKIDRRIIEDSLEATKALGEILKEISKEGKLKDRQFFLSGVQG